MAWREVELSSAEETPVASWRKSLHTIIFGSDTGAGKTFDIILLWAILLSVVFVVLESVSEIRERYSLELHTVEWIFTILFTIEYALRIISVRRPFRYIFSFFGMVDLLAILPAYLDLFFDGSYFLITVRVLRLLRVFRIFKLGRYLGAAEIIMIALRNARHKIVVFMGAVAAAVVIIGSLMYVIEGVQNPDSRFTSIPAGIYWAIVTLTTVGFGDITPETPLGRALAAVVMLIGYAIIAVPTGIVSAEMARAKAQYASVDLRTCLSCGGEDHSRDANHCKHCGAKLDQPEESK